MKQVKQLLRYPVVLVFFLFLFGYTLFDLTQTDREYSEFENKYLAQKAAFHHEGVSEQRMDPGL